MRTGSNLPLIGPKPNRRCRHPHQMVGPHLSNQAKPKTMSSIIFGTTTNRRVSRWVPISMTTSSVTWMAGRLLSNDLSICSNSMGWDSHQSPTPKPMATLMLIKHLVQPVSTKAVQSFLTHASITIQIMKGLMGMLTIGSGSASLSLLLVIGSSPGLTVTAPMVMGIAC